MEWCMPTVRLVNMSVFPDPAINSPKFARRVLINEEVPYGKDIVATFAVQERAQGNTLVHEGAFEFAHYFMEACLVFLLKLEKCFKYPVAILTKLSIYYHQLLKLRLISSVATHELYCEYGSETSCVGREISNKTTMRDGNFKKICLQIHTFLYPHKKFQSHTHNKVHVLPRLILVSTSIVDGRSKLGCGRDQGRDCRTTLKFLGNNQYHIRSCCEHFEVGTTSQSRVMTKKQLKMALFMLSHKPGAAPLCVSLTLLHKPSYGFPRRGFIFVRDTAGFGV
eukprot:sb/3467913/